MDCVCRKEIAELRREMEEACKLVITQVNELDVRMTTNFVSVEMLHERADGIRMLLRSKLDAAVANVSSISYTPRLF